MARDACSEARTVHAGKRADGHVAGFSTRFGPDAPELTSAWWEAGLSVPRGSSLAVRSEESIRIRPCHTFDLPRAREAAVIPG